MKVMIWMLVGGIAGWVACSVLHLNMARGLIVSAMIGVGGALLGGYVLAPMFGGTVAEAGAFSPFALVMAFVSALACLTVTDMMYERLGW